MPSPRPTMLWTTAAVGTALVSALALTSPPVRPAPAAPVVTTAASEAAPDTVDRRALRRRLTPLQWRVTQEEGTEPPYRNAYWDNHAAGIYVDLVSGEALFSSLDKYDSGTGWPSFTRPLVPANIREVRDADGRRTEVRSRRGDAHLGHVFDDGPAPTGLRYCMNSAALRFIPAARLQAEGYGQYARLFQRRR